MPYRRPAGEEERPHVVRYGPFPLRWMEVGLGVAGLVVLLAAAAVLGGERIACERTGGEAVCTVGRTSLILPDRLDRFTTDDVVEVRFVPYEGDKRSERGRTELIDRIGRPRVLFDTGREEARAAFEVIEAFFRDPTQRTMTYESDPAWLGAALLLLVGLFAVAAGVTGLRQVTSIRLHVYPRSGRLRVRRRWLGIPLGTTELSTEDVSEVRVEPGAIPVWTRQRRQGPLEGGRLLLVTRRGEALPLTERALPGTWVHQAAAAELRALMLGEEADEVPQAAAGGKPRRSHSGRRVLLGFAGIALFAVAAQGVVVLYANQTQGWLEVQCAHRCRLGSWECLPGGAWSSSMDPGTYTMEVWNPDVEGHWEPVRFRIEQGRTTTFVCRAGAEDAEPGD